MFGAYRLILAFLVVFSHYGLPVPLLNGIHTGVFAVVQFFMLSGYAMTGLFRKQYLGKKHSARFFYADRALRILPLYFFFATLALVAHLAFQLPGLTPGGFDFRDAVVNLTLIPITYDELFIVYPLILIPVASSLGVEEQFYFIFPFIFRSQILKWVLFATTFSIFVLGSFHVLDPMRFMYSWPIGTTWIFITGSLIYDCFHRTEKHASRYFPSIAILLAVSLVFSVTRYFFSPLPFRQVSIFYALFLGMPLIGLLGHLPSRRWDEALGKNSYGVFLSHLLVGSMVRKFVGFNPREACWALLLTALVSWFGARYVEPPFIRWRSRVRTLFQAKAGPEKG